MEEKKGISPPTNIGISLLLVVFLILCLFTFSAIALVQAGNESETSKTTAESRTAYYTALNNAEDSLYKKNTALKQNGAVGAAPTVAEDFPISKDRALKVTYTLVNANGIVRYEITDCKSVSTSDWVGDDSVNIIR